MALLTPQYLAVSGTAVSYSAANAGGDTMPYEDGKQILHVKNGSGASVTVTLTRQNTSLNVPGEGPVALSNVTVTVPAGADRFISRFPRSLVDSSSNVVIGYSAVTSVTVAVLKVAQP